MRWYRFIGWPDAFKCVEGRRSKIRVDNPYKKVQKSEVWKAAGVPSVWNERRNNADPWRLTDERRGSGQLSSKDIVVEKQIRRYIGMRQTYSNGEFRHGDIILVYDASK